MKSQKNSFSKYEELINPNIHAKKIVSLNGRTNNFHTHKALEVLFVLTPHAICEVNGKKIEVQKNSVLLFNNSDLHRMTCDEKYEYSRYVLTFNPEKIDKMFAQDNVNLTCFYIEPFTDKILILNDSEAQEITELFERIIKADNERELFGAELLIKAILIELLVKINRLCPYKSKSDALAVYKTVNFVYNNLTEKITLKMLADTVFMSQKKLCEIFLEILGDSPMKYVKKIRLNQAKEYLLNGYSVKESSEKSGFENISYFCSVFKKETGVSPKKYSKN